MAGQERAGQGNNIKAVQGRDAAVFGVGYIYSGFLCVYIGICGSTAGC